MMCHAIPIPVDSLHYQNDGQLRTVSCRILVQHRPATQLNAHSTNRLPQKAHLVLLVQQALLRHTRHHPRLQA